MADALPWRFDLEGAVLDAFRAALQSPHFANLLGQAGVDVHAVISLPAFRRLVPIFRKGQLFARDVPFHRLCIDGEIGPIRSVMVSSGFSGNNSYSVATAEELIETRTGIDAALDLFFETDQTHTLLINAFPMGIHLPTRHALAETGPRSDLALKVLDRFGPYFEQTIVLADPHLLKRIVDEGNEMVVDWQARNVSFVAGEDWLPQTLRAYIHAETGIADDDRRVLMGTMGLTELGLNLFFETRETIRLRRRACADEKLRLSLFPGSGPAVPSLFHFDPARFYIESAPHRDGRELVFTSLSAARRVPMIRYASGDLGDVMTPLGLCQALDCVGLLALQPTLPLPCGWVAGRENGIQTAAGHLRVEDLRHGIYGDLDVARAVTGHFTVHGSGGAKRAAVQLRHGVAVSTPLRKATELALFSATDITLATDLYTYEEYPFGKDLNYEMKFRHSL